jgi:hypothetical protein
MRASLIPTDIINDAYDATPTNPLCEASQAPRSLEELPLFN